MKEEIIEAIKELDYSSEEVGLTYKIYAFIRIWTFRNGSKCQSSSLLMELKIL